MCLASADPFDDRCSHPARSSTARLHRCTRSSIPFLPFPLHPANENSCPMLHSYSSTPRNPARTSPTNPGIMVCIATPRSRPSFYRWHSACSMALHGARSLYIIPTSSPTNRGTSSRGKKGKKSRFPRLTIFSNRWTMLQRENGTMTPSRSIAHSCVALPHRCRLFFGMRFADVSSRARGRGTRTHTRAGGASYFPPMTPAFISVPELGHQRAGALLPTLAGVCSRDPQRCPCIQRWPALAGR